MTAPRPLGATLLAFVLGWLGIAAFANVLVWRTLPSALEIPPASPLDQFVAAASGPMFLLIALAYGVTAVAACVGVWRMRPWMSKAFLLWAAAVMLEGVWMFWAIPDELIHGGPMAGAAFLLACAALLWLVYRYVRKIESRGPHGQPA